MSDTPKKKPLSLKDRPADTTQRVEERLHKVLAQAGLGSRRALEERIAQGLVKINGEVARTGQSISSGDRIELDGKTFVATALTEPASVLIYNKPEGQVTSREDPEGRPTIFESLPRLKGARWIAVGRLDINTTGLLLLTTDGELAHALMHPSNEIEREYVCRIPGEVPDNVVDRLARGVALEDGPAKFESIERINATGSHAWFQVVVTEGRNREVRRLWESQGHQVSRLKRVRYGDVTLPRLLKRGQCVEMEAAEVEKLRARFGLENNPPVLTLQPVIGQRKARPTHIRIGKDGAQNSFVNAHVNEEARELRRFDHVREDKPRGRGRPRPGGAPGGARKPYKSGGARTFTGPMDHRSDDNRGNAAPRGNKKPFGAPHAGRRDDNVGNRAERPAFQRSGPPGAHPQGPRGPRPPHSPQGAPGGYKGQKPRGPVGGQPPHSGHDGNKAEFRSWYVPEGVETGSKVAPPRGGPRGPGGPRPKGAYGNAPQGAPGNHAPRGPRPPGAPGRGPQGGQRGPPGPNAGPRGPRSGQGTGPRGPQGHPPNGPGPQARGPRGPKPPFRKRPEGLPSDD
jgi:23S rRNA pseudouridine2605 synthase